MTPLAQKIARLTKRLELEDTIGSVEEAFVHELAHIAVSRGSLGMARRTGSRNGSAMRACLEWPPARPRQATPGAPALETDR